MHHPIFSLLLIALFSAFIASLSFRASVAHSREPKLWEEFPPTLRELIASQPMVSDHPASSGTNVAQVGEWVGIGVDHRPYVR